MRNHLRGEGAVAFGAAAGMGPALGRIEASVGEGQRRASGVVRKALAVRAAGSRGAPEEQLGIARHTTEPADHVP